MNTKRFDLDDDEMFVIQQALLSKRQSYHDNTAADDDDSKSFYDNLLRKLGWKPLAAKQAAMRARNLRKLTGE